MSNEIEFRFIGWQCDKATNTDKVWVAFKVNGDYYSAWGRRGKTLQFKHFQYGSELAKVQRQKEAKYSPVDKFELFVMFPDFEAEVASQLSFSILADKVR